LATKVPWRGVRLLLHLAGSVRVQLTASRGATVRGLILF
jgi:hypothetical protein